MQSNSWAIKLVKKLSFGLISTDAQAMAAIVLIFIFSLLLSGLLLYQTFKPVSVPAPVSIDENTEPENS